MGRWHEDRAKYEIASLCVRPCKKLAQISRAKTMTWLSQRRFYTCILHASRHETTLWLREERVTTT